MNTQETIRAAITLMQDVLDHQRRHSRGAWERAIFDLPFHRVTSPEVALLVNARVVQYIHNVTNPDLPDYCLRILQEEIPVAEALIAAYVNGLGNAEPVRMPLPDPPMFLKERDLEYPFFMEAAQPPR